MEAAFMKLAEYSGASNVVLTVFVGWLVFSVKAMQRDLQNMKEHIVYKDTHKAMYDAISNNVQMLIKKVFNGGGARE